MSNIEYYIKNLNGIKKKKYTHRAYTFHKN